MRGWEQSGNRDEAQPCSLPGSLILGWGGEDGPQFKKGSPQCCWLTSICKTKNGGGSGR